MSNNLSSYTCQVCIKILLKPILLPCSECDSSSSSSICQEHLSELFPNNAKEALVKCKKCETKVNLIKADLKENSQLNLNLQRHAYLSDEKLKLKLTIDAKLDEMEKYLTDVNELKVKEYRVRIHNHFYGCRNDVDIRRETLLEKKCETISEYEIEEINRLSKNLIEQLDLTENEFRNNFMHKLKTFIIDEMKVNEFRLRLNEMLRSICLSVEDLREFKIEHGTKLTQVQNEFTRIDEKFNARLKANRFEEFNINYRKYFYSINPLEYRRLSLLFKLKPKCFPATFGCQDFFLSK